MNIEVKLGGDFYKNLNEWVNTASQLTNEKLVQTLIDKF